MASQGILLLPLCDIHQQQFRWSWSCYLVMVDFTQGSNSSSSIKYLHKCSTYSKIRRGFIFQLNDQYCFLGNSCYSDVWRKTSKWLNYDLFVWEKYLTTHECSQDFNNSGLVYSPISREKRMVFWERFISFWEFPMALAWFSPTSIRTCAHAHIYSHMLSKSFLHKSVPCHF